MKGYVFLLEEEGLIIKSQEYIETIDPGFESDNSHKILFMKKFDSEDNQSVLEVLTMCSRFRLTKSQVDILLMSIGRPPSPPSLKRLA